MRREGERRVRREGEREESEEGENKGVSRRRSNVIGYRVHFRS